MQCFVALTVAFRLWKTWAISAFCQIVKHDPTTSVTALKLIFDSLRSTYS